MRDVVRALHQRDLGGRLDHAAARGDRVALAKSSAGASALRTPSKMKKRTRSSTPTLPVATPRSLRMPARRPVRDSRLPARRGRRRPNFDQLARAFLLEAGRDPGEFALGGDDQRRTAARCGPSARP